MESFRDDDIDEPEETNLSRTNHTLLGGKHKNKLFQTMNSTFEEIRNTEIVSGKLFDYKETKENALQFKKKSTKGIWNIYFYMSEVCKIKKASGIQFISDRYLNKSKDYYKSTIMDANNEDEEIFTFEEHQSKMEETKDVGDEGDQDKEIRKLKFEKYILLFLLGSCDLAEHYGIRQKYMNDFKEIIHIMKINKINELKRLNKNSINYEILVDMVKEPVDLDDFIQYCLPELKRETNEILQQADDKLSDLLKASEQLELQIEILKTDIENMDFIK